MRTKKRAIVTEAPRASKGAEPRAPVAPRGPLVGARFIGSAAAPAQLPPPGTAEIAFAGRSNSGKSSAINALARHAGLAFASRTPGRTRLVNFFALRSGARVADLPGYGYAAVPQAVKRTWQDLLWTYVTTRDALVGMVLVVDARHGLRPLDIALLEGFVPSGRPVLILATKTDKLGAGARRTAIATLERTLVERFPVHASAMRVVGFSAATRTGVDAADAIIDAWLSPAPACGA
jgi:GTP-binding protein